VELSGHGEYLRKLQPEERGGRQDLIADLQLLGHRLWYDQELTGGQSWWSHILEEVRTAEVFVFALTPESMATLACKHKPLIRLDLSRRKNG
jgi:hypothetical protein